MIYKQHSPSRENPGRNRNVPERAADPSRSVDAKDAGTLGTALVPVLLITSNASFAKRLERELRASAEVALSVRGAPSNVTPLSDLVTGVHARVIVVDAALLESGLVRPSSSLGNGGQVSPELLLAFGSIGEPAVELSLLSHAHGCVEFGITAEAFAHAVDTVANGGEFWFPRWMMEPIYDRALSAIDASRARPALESENVDSDLTEREFEVVRLVRCGMTNKEVGKKLGISPNTVKKHVHNVLHKHGILRRRQLFE